MNSELEDVSVSGPESARVQELLGRMRLREKIGQMSQLQGGDGSIPHDLSQAIREGRVGSVLNEVDPGVVNELQRIAVEESRLGIPLLMARDVIHGFKTIMPIPLGQAATWNPQLIEEGARVAACEAASIGVNWTFAPMIDITRDPRWGRIAESLGEDPYLCTMAGVATLRGFQGEDLGAASSIAACAKHFAAYGAAEGGRDYGTANVPENELRNVYLRPFKALAEAGVASFMSAFCDLDGIPATGNHWLLDQVLRGEWRYQGVLVSDWESVVEMTVHGYTEDDQQAAFEALGAGVDMEMASTAYDQHLEHLVQEKRVSLEQIDRMVARVLALKFRLGLFERPYTRAEDFPALCNPRHLQTARELARQSCVLLKNEQQLLPLSASRLKRLALIGPLADDGYEQMGTWVFDGEARHSVTCRQAIEELLGDSVEVQLVPALETTRSASVDDFAAARAAAAACDLSVLVVGEESFMSGEAHSRACIDLPGAQAALIEAVAEAGGPVIAVIMAGRPLTIEAILPHVDALLYAWHPGSMGGPAIVDLLFGLESPSGKLPVTFPRVVGQVPIHYAHKNSGRPATADSCVNMADVAPRAAQTSLGMTSFYLDAGYRPLFPFGFGLSYGEFQYTNIAISKPQIAMGETMDIAAEVVNIGVHAAEEVVQLYVRDLVGSVTRPVKELKAFQRLQLRPGEHRQVSFSLHTEELGFYGRDRQFRTEPGRFQVWIGGCSDAALQAEFELRD